MAAEPNRGAPLVDCPGAAYWSGSGIPVEDWQTDSWLPSEFCRFMNRSPFAGVANGLKLWFRIATKDVPTKLRAEAAGRALLKLPQPVAIQVIRMPPRSPFQARCFPVLLEEGR